MCEPGFSAGQASRAHTRFTRSVCFRCSRSAAVILYIILCVAYIFYAYSRPADKNGVSTLYYIHYTLCYVRATREDKVTLRARRTVQ